MADRRRGRRKSDEASQKLSKEEDAIARYVRFNCPTKSTMFEGNEVHYFTGSKAVDILVESKKYGSQAKNPKFVNRAAAAIFMRALLEKRLFFRARKLVPKRKDDKKDAKDIKEKEKVDVSKSPKKRAKKDEVAQKEAQKDGKDKKKKEESEENEDEEEKEDKKSKDKDEDEKKKRKVKLELHHDQTFNDAGEVYVWIFDPTPLYKKVIGALMVLGTIAGCLFPLWPMWVRQGVYYISLAGLGCFGVLIGVAIARTILFAVIWATTMGTHKLWLLPNLTEDCGFFESFHPWYTYEYCPSGVTPTGKKKKKGEEKKKTEEEEALLEKKVDETSGITEIVPKSEEEEGELKLDENAEGDRAAREADDVGDSSEEGSVSEDDEEDSSQATTNGGSMDDKGDAEKAEDEKPRGDATKVRQRRRARRADDDFVLVDKQ